ncbi:hypothetical protein O6H91_Y485700 [Diphasiastrum complanatum]|nr:hypothetical protein O6H91_Y485700 [Diphasiastrum complanatum]
MKSEEEISRRRGEVSGAVTYEWLTQAEAARFHKDPDNFKPLRASSLVGQQQQRLSDEREGLFSVIDEFNLWRSKPELAEAVAAIKALTAVIQRSEATTMMGLEIDLKKASEALKVLTTYPCLNNAALLKLNPYDVPVEVSRAFNVVIDVYKNKCSSFSFFRGFLFS